MASIVITLPNRKTIVVVAPNGEQVIPVLIHQCECGCDQWFNTSDERQLYVNTEHQIAANNQKRRKTARRQS